MFRCFFLFFIVQLEYQLIHICFLLPLPCLFVFLGICLCACVFHSYYPFLFSVCFLSFFLFFSSCLIVFVLIFIFIFIFLFFSCFSFFMFVFVSIVVHLSKYFSLLQTVSMMIIKIRLYRTRDTSTPIQLMNVESVKILSLLRKEMKRMDLFVEIII